MSQSSFGKQYMSQESLITDCFRRDACSGIKSCPLYNAFSGEIGGFFSRLSSKARITGMPEDQYPRDSEPSRHMDPKYMMNCAMRVFSAVIDGKDETGPKKEVGIVILSGLKDRVLVREDGEEYTDGCHIEARMMGKLPELNSSLHRIRHETEYSLQPSMETDTPERVARPKKLA